MVFHAYRRPHLRPLDRVRTVYRGALAVKSQEEAGVVEGAFDIFVLTLVLCQLPAKPRAYYFHSSRQVLKQSRKSATF